MLQQQNSFYVILSSNGSLNYYPENTLSKFTVKLPYTIELSNNENWTVGLHSASIPKFQYVKVQNVSVKFNNSYTTFVNTPATIITLISCSKLFFATIEREVKDNSFFKKFKNVKYNKLSDKIDTSKNVKIAFVEGFDVYLEHSTEYSVDKLFNSIYSQIPETNRVAVNKIFQDNLKNVEFQNSSLFGNAFEEIIVNPVHKIFFYIDIIKPQIINSTLARALYISPIKSSMEDNFELSIQNIKYCGLDKYYFNEISVLITNEFGDQINFEDGSNYTSLVLHFSKAI